MADDNIIDPIIAAIKAGELVDAERRCRDALQITPDDVDVVMLLALGLQRQNRVSDALKVFARLTELRPDESMHWSNYATALRLAGDMDGAERAADKADRLAPDQPERLEQLGLLRLATGKLAEAREALMRAHELAPDSARIAIHAAQACIACRDSRADDLLQDWRKWLPLENHLEAELADALVQVSDVFAALEVLKSLTARRPYDWRAQLWLAKVYERVNQPDAAAAKLEWVVASGAVGCDRVVEREVDLQQAQLALRRHEYAVAKELLQRAGSSDEQDYGYYFTLARVEDKLAQPDAAMAALAVAHSRQVRELRASNPNLLKSGAPVLPRIDDRVTADQYHAWPEIKAPDRNQSPIFVVGFPRSGTTLLEQMLDAHPRLQSMDERPFFNALAHQLASIGVDVPQDLGKLDQRDCDELRKGYVMMACGKVPRRWDARLVDKNPLNMRWLPMIQRLFPDAQFILALRHPCDVILSCYLQDFRAAPLAAACRSLGVLAQAYVAAMRNWLHHVEVFRPDVFVSRYEDLVADTDSQTSKIASFLGLDDAAPMRRFDARAREKGFIRTPSYTQVIEPISAGGIGHWQRYRSYFEPVLPILAPMLEHWGYATRATPGTMV